MDDSVQKTDLGQMIGGLFVLLVVAVVLLPVWGGMAVRAFGSDQDPWDVWPARATLIVVGLVFVVGTIRMWREKPEGPKTNSPVAYTYVTSTQSLPPSSNG